MKHSLKIDKHSPKIEEPRSSSLSSVLNNKGKAKGPFYFGGTEFSVSNPWVKVAQTNGWALFSAMSHRTKLSQRSRPDGWVTLPDKVARLFGLTEGIKVRAVDECAAAGLLLVKRGKHSTSPKRYRFAPIKGRPLSPAERSELTE